MAKPNQAKKSEPASFKKPSFKKEGQSFSTQTKKRTGNETSLTDRNRLAERVENSVEKKGLIKVLSQNALRVENQELLNHETRAFTKENQENQVNLNSFLNEGEKRPEKEIYPDEKALNQANLNDFSLEKKGNPKRNAGARVNGPEQVGQPALTQGEKELFMAIESNNADQVQSLLKEGANPNALNEYGQSALQVAAEKGSAEMVEALIDKGANVNAVSSSLEARAPLSVAAEKGNERMVGALLSAGASVEHKDEQGKTALHYASNSAVLNELVEKGADINAEDLNGQTPLHSMAARGQTEVIETAFSLGADVNKADVNGRTALETMALNGNEKILAALNNSSSNEVNRPAPHLTKRLSEDGQNITKVNDEISEERQRPDLASRGE